MGKLDTLLEHYHKGGVSRAGMRTGRYAFGKLNSIFTKVSHPISINIHSRLTPWLNIFNADWDLLIILDGCRVDALRQVAPEYPFIEKIESKWSVGAHSSEWVANTFSSEYQNEISKTAYISSNPEAWVVFNGEFEEHPHKDIGSRKHTDQLKKHKTTQTVKKTDFHTFELLYGELNDYGHGKFPSPRSITDRTIALDRGDNSPQRIITHYMPPHPPYITRVVDGKIKHAEEPRQDTFEAYLDNLRWGLEEVSLLLENTDRDKVVITADHGWGFWLQSVRSNHKPGMLGPDIRRVPWVETSATDKRTHNPDLSETQVEERMSPEETLEALGYLS